MPGSYPHLAIFTALTAAGHSSRKALAIIRSAKRGNRFARAWIAAILYPSACRWTLRPADLWVQR